MTKFSKALACGAVALAMALHGCATPSAGIDTPSALTKEKAGKLKVGASKEEVISILGEPVSRLVTENGETLFFKDVNLSSVWVLLGSDGRVSDWERSE